MLLGISTQSAGRIIAENAMRAGETELQTCVRHVAEQEARIARQDVLVERLRESGSRLLDDALQLLAEMHGLLEKMHEHVARLSKLDQAASRLR